MSTAAQRARASSSRKRSTSSKKNSRWFFGITVGVLVALFAIAIAMTRSSEQNNNTQTANVEQSRAVTIRGEALPLFPNQGADQAIGMQSPTFNGEAFDGKRISVGVDGRPKVVMFLAHWCSHCQADVKTIQSWIDDNGAPEDVDLYAVSTWADAAKPNFPPSEWLEREGWTTTTIADDSDSSVAAHFGLSGTPMYVFIDDQGIVQWRYSGELPIDALEPAIDDLR